MITRKLREFLDSNQVKYLTIGHSEAYTALECAEASHISGKELAKTVIVFLDGEQAMCVLPATERIVEQNLKDAIGAEEVRLATEAEFQDRFSGCEVGAMPPFGNLYGMKVYVSEGLAMDEEIAFNAGTHTELIKMKFKDFARLVKPIVLDFGRVATPA